MESISEHGSATLRPPGPSEVSATLQYFPMPTGASRTKKEEYPQPSSDRYFQRLSRCIVRGKRTEEFSIKGSTTAQALHYRIHIILERLTAWRRNSRRLPRAVCIPWHSASAMAMRNKGCYRPRLREAASCGLQAYSSVTERTPALKPPASKTLAVRKGTATRHGGRQKIFISRVKHST